jgi:flagellar biogenesis protein FliO
MTQGAELLFILASFAAIIILLVYFIVVRYDRSKKDVSGIDDVSKQQSGEKSFVRLVAYVLVWPLSIFSEKNKENPDVPLWSVALLVLGLFFAVLIVIAGSWLMS